MRYIMVREPKPQSWVEGNELRNYKVSLLARSNRETSWNVKEHFLAVMPLWAKQLLPAIVLRQINRVIFNFKNSTFVRFRQNLKILRMVAKFERSQTSKFHKGVRDYWFDNKTSPVSWFCWNKMKEKKSMNDTAKQSGNKLVIYFLAAGNSKKQVWIFPLINEQSTREEKWFKVPPSSINRKHTCGWTSCFEYTMKVGRWNFSDQWPSATARATAPIYIIYPTLSYRFIRSFLSSFQ